MHATVPPSGVPVPAAPLAPPHRLRRTAPDTLELWTPEGTLLDGVWTATLRDPSLPLPRGTTIALDAFSATVREGRDGKPTRVAFRFDRPLDDPSLVFLAVIDGRLRRIAIPRSARRSPSPGAGPTRARRAWGVRRRRPRRSHRGRSARCPMTLYYLIERQGGWFSAPSPNGDSVPGPDRRDRVGDRRGDRCCGAALNLRQGSGRPVSGRIASCSRMCEEVGWQVPQRVSWRRCS